MNKTGERERERKVGRSLGMLQGSSPHSCPPLLLAICCWLANSTRKVDSSSCVARYPVCLICREGKCMYYGKERVKKKVEQRSKL